MSLAERLAGVERPLFYLAIPPVMFDDVVQGLARVGLTGTGSRVVVEKPFGRDLASAAELNTVLHDVFPEEAVFGIDHFLDMGRSATNVIGNGIAATVVAKWEGELDDPATVDKDVAVEPLR